MGRGDSLLRTHWTLEPTREGRDPFHRLPGRSTVGAEDGVHAGHNPLAIKLDGVGADPTSHLRFMGSLLSVDAECCVPRNRGILGTRGRTSNVQRSTPNAESANRQSAIGNRTSKIERFMES
jgi:hypothetical protein